MYIIVYLATLHVKVRYHELVIHFRTDFMFPATRTGSISYSCLTEN